MANARASELEVPLYPARWALADPESDSGSWRTRTGRHVRFQAGLENTQAISGAGGDFPISNPMDIEVASIE